MIGSTTACDADAADFQIVSGQYITLKSDISDRDQLTDWVTAFDSAVPQWCKFLGVPVTRLSDWKIDAFVMRDRNRFIESRDLPIDVRMRFGYAIHGNIWVMNQKGSYYTRHLLLHEGVHALILELYGVLGPPWYAEGLAETLGVHRMSATGLEVGGVPSSNEVVPYWGRFPLVRKAREQSKVPTLQRLFDLKADWKGDVESYAWAWIAFMLLTEYESYRPATIAATEDLTLTRDRFMQRFQSRLADAWPVVQARWRLLANTIDYGFDWERERCKLSKRDPLWNGQGFTYQVDSSLGWQSCGVRFAPGQTVRLKASGECSMNPDPQPWLSQPPGVTIRYVNGRPLGQLLYCILPNATRETEWLEPLPIASLEANETLKLDQHCWLLFRINDAASEMGDNEGGYQVTIKE